MNDVETGVWICSICGKEGCKASDHAGWDPTIDRGRVQRKEKRKDSIANFAKNFNKIHILKKENADLKTKIRELTEINLIQMHKLVNAYLLKVRIGELEKQLRGKNESMAKNSRRTALIPT